MAVDNSHVINLGRLTTFAQRGLLPIKSSSDAHIATLASEAGAHGIRYKDGKIQVEITEYTAVTPQAGDNPKENGWYELESGKYALTADTTVTAGKTYYSRSTSWDDAGGGGTTIVQIPTVTVGSYTYNGTPQGPAVSGLDTANVTATHLQETDAGTYTLTLHLSKANAVWTDMTTADKTYTYTIGKATATIPSVSGSFTYNGQVKTANISNFDSDTMEQGGTASATAHGTYTVTFNLKDTTNYKWTDDSITQKTGSWSIAKAQLTAPTVSGSFTYNGQSKSATITGYSSTTMTQGGDASATNAGTYTVTFSLKDSANYEWSDGTTAQKSGTWTIDRASGTITVTSDSVTLDADHTSVSITVGGNGADWTASSSDTSIATVSKNGNTLTITSPNEDSGTATITISRAQNTNYTAATKTVEVSAEFSQIFGVQWDGSSSSAMSRTDAAANFTDPVPAVNNGNGSSPFDEFMPWSGMKRVADSTGGTLVEIPKFWYKWTRSGSTMKLQISNGPEDGFFVSPAHADRGDGTGERDVVYVGAYHCDSSYKSTSGVKPLGSKTRAEFRSGIHNLSGGKFWQMDYAMLWTIRMLYLVEYADWNSQAKIGYGCGNNSGTENAGLCDSMIYHTGTNAQNRTTYGHTRYRYIEDLWGNVYDWCDGIYFSGADVYCIKNPSSFSDSSGGTKVGTRATSGNCIKAWNNPSASGFEYALYPSEVVSDSSYATYVCDSCGYNASGVVLYVGGNYSQNQYYGLFCMYGNNAATNSSANIGSRLQKLP